MSKRATELSNKGRMGRNRMNALRESLLGVHSQSANNLLGELSKGREINANQRLFLSKFIDLMNYVTPRMASTELKGGSEPIKIEIVDFSKSGK